MKNACRSSRAMTVSLAVYTPRLSDGTYLYAIASQAQGAHASNVPAQVTNRRAKGDPIVMSDFVSVNCKCGSVSCDVLRAAVTWTR